jgi:hypothetical protein
MKHHLGTGKPNIGTVSGSVGDQDPVGSGPFCRIRKNFDRIRI